MFSFGFASAHRAARVAGRFGAAFAISAVTSLTLMPAHAQEIRLDGCTAAWGAANCVTLWAEPEDPFIREVPQPTDPAAKARAAEMDRRWADRCRPVILQDPYGVARYAYAMPGCEFGVGDIDSRPIR